MTGFGVFVEICSLQLQDVFINWYPCISMMVKAFSFVDQYHVYFNRYIIKYAFKSWINPIQCLRIDDIKFYFKVKSKSGYFILFFGNKKDLNIFNLKLCKIKNENTEEFRYILRLKINKTNNKIINTINPIEGRNRDQ